MASLCAGPFRLAGAKLRPNRSLSPARRTTLAERGSFDGVEVPALAVAANSVESAPVGFGRPRSRLRLILPRPSAFSFLLEGRSAFVDGQSWTVGSAGASTSSANGSHSSTQSPSKQTPSPATTPGHHRRPADQHPQCCRGVVNCLGVQHRASLASTGRIAAAPLPGARCGRSGLTQPGAAQSWRAAEPASAAASPVLVGSG